jgi:hypothetical protein
MPPNQKLIKTLLHFYSASISFILSDQIKSRRHHGKTIHFTHAYHRQKFESI